MEHLSTEANIGRIFLMIGFIVGFIGALFLIFYGIFWTAFDTMIMPAAMGVFFLVMAIIKIAGSVLITIAYNDAKNHNFHKAGVMGIIGSVISLLNIFGLIGAILCFVSKEAKRR